MSNIYNYVTEQKAAYQLPISLDGWDWNMPTHLKTSFYYKHGRLLNGNDENTPVRNITLPILNLQYRTEDIDVKDIYLWIENKDLFHLSFLVKKYHDEVYVKEHNVDDLLDKMGISRIDFGGTLVKDFGDGSPEVVPLQSISFCDQADILNSPIGFFHQYTPDRLKEMESKGWGNPANGATISIDELITLSKDEKAQNSKDDGIKNKSTQNIIRIEEVHGVLPDSYYDENGDDLTFSRQMQIVGFYKDTNGDDVGVCLFKKKMKKNPLKLNNRVEIFGRGLGLGGAEELFEAQVWTNYSEIVKKDFLDSASKTILASDDPKVTQKHQSGLKGLNNLEIIDIDPGKTIKKIDTFPTNFALFENATKEWLAHAQITGAANDSIMGINPNSGTPFKLQELVTQESHGLHEHRRGQFAKFVEEIYRDWIIPFIAKEITKGTEFISSLSLEEMQTVYDSVVVVETNKFLKEKILNGEMIDPVEVKNFQTNLRIEFMKDNKKFLKILEGELKNINIKIEINIGGKQKHLAAMVDRLVNVFRQVMANPDILNDPRMAKLFNQILEGSGMSPIDFGTPTGIATGEKGKTELESEKLAPKENEVTNPTK